MLLFVPELLIYLLLKALFLFITYILVSANNGVIKVKTPLLEFIEQKKAEKLRSKEEKKEERRRKEFERKKARDEDKRKKKEVKDHRDMKKKEDHKDDSSVKVRGAIALLT